MSMEVVRGRHVAEVEEMANTYTAVTKHAGQWWIGWIEEVPGVNCQERTREKLLESLRITLAEAIVRARLCFHPLTFDQENE